MALVNPQTLADIKSAKTEAIKANSYERGYNRAMRALDAAIAQLEQISMMTSDFEVTLVKR